MDENDFTYGCVPPLGSAHRRGAAINPTNRFEKQSLHILGEEVDRQQVEWAEEGKPRNTVTRQVFYDRTQSIINRVAQTSDVPFDWTLNPYRGCEHGCIYCFARPYHEYLGFSSGLDFETKLMAKLDAPELLVKELANPKWKPEPIVMSAITDIYQPIEHQYQLSRKCLQILADCGQPVTTMTKSALVLRDTDLWSQLASRNAGRVTVTLVTLDAELAKTLEPRASAPSARLRIIRNLTKAGVPVSVNIAPIIPGLTDIEVPALLEAIAEAGALRANWVILRLPYQLKEIFLDWLQRNVHPQRAEKVESLLRQMHNGKLYEASTGVRRRGKGPIAESIKQTFEVFSRKFGLHRELPPLTAQHFKRPTTGRQMELW